jgi:hypothetical protein
MPWMMHRSSFDFFPSVRCDQCNAEIGSASNAYAAWPVDILADPRDSVVSVICSQECLDAVGAERESEGEWIATPFAVYVANLIFSLGIDVNRVLETEQASVAAEKTRDQAPD